VHLELERKTNGHGFASSGVDLLVDALLLDEHPGPGEVAPMLARDSEAACGAQMARDMPLLVECPGTGDVTVLAQDSEAAYGVQVALGTRLLEERPGTGDVVLLAQ